MNDTNKKKLYAFNPPVDKNGKKLWVPLVVHSKAYMVGFVHSCRQLSEIFDTPMGELLQRVSLDSSRFNDITINDERFCDLSKEKRVEYLSDMNDIPNRDDHIENNYSIYAENDYVIECPGCRMNYIFKNIEEDLPDKFLNCKCCDRPLIRYVNVYDTNIVFDGNIDVIDQAYDDYSNTILGEDEDSEYDE